MKYTILFLTSLLVVTNARAVSNESIDSLNKIASFAKDICMSPSLEGKNNNFSLNLNASTKTNRLINKLVGLKVDGAAKYIQAKYNNVLQSELAKAIKDSNDCRLQVLKILEFHFDINPATKPAKVIHDETSKPNISKKTLKTRSLQTRYSTQAGVKSATGVAVSNSKGCFGYAGPDGASSSCSSGKGTTGSSFANEKNATANGSK